MLIVRVELHSAITGETTEIARMMIANDGRGTETRGNYNAVTYTGRTKADLDKERWCRTGYVNNWPRKTRHVWELVMVCLHGCGYRIPDPRKDRHAWAR